MYGKHIWWATIWRATKRLVDHSCHRWPNCGQYTVVKYRRRILSKCLEFPAEFPVRILNRTNVIGFRGPTNSRLQSAATAANESLATIWKVRKNMWHVLHDLTPIASVRPCLLVKRSSCLKTNLYLCFLIIFLSFSSDFPFKALIWKSMMSFWFSDDVS